MNLQSRYTILRKIADGGTAEIFLAKQHGAQGFEKVVVLKRIFPSFYADPLFRHMLVDEAHVAMSLNHSNIVQVLDLGEADGRYFLALEMVDGWSLDAVLRRAKASGVPFPPPLALYVTAEVCRALAYAHGKQRDGQPLGIVHRDVSPHNILVSEQGEVKLTDFGIAKAQNRREQTLGNVIKGKIAFMSPEQASGTDLDARSDLFSLGTMLYVMITRRYPFDAPTDFETLMQVRSGDFLPPETARSGLNPELYRVIRKAMGKTPPDRYQRAEDMLIDVEQVMRLAFRPVGQTELMRWLAELAERDGAAALTRDTTGTVAGAPGAHPFAPLSGDDSAIILDAHDVQDISAEDDPALSAPHASVAAIVPTPLAPPPPLAPPALAPSSLAAPPPVAPPSHATEQPSPSVAPAPTAVIGRPGRRRLTVALLIGGTAAAALLAMGVLRSRRATTSAPPASPIAAVAPAPAAVPTTTATDGPVAESDDGAAAVAPLGDANVDDGVMALQPTPEPPAPENAPPGIAPAVAAQPEKNQVAVTITSKPEGARVTLRNSVVGTTPLTLRLKQGAAYQLTFTKAGYSPLSKRGRVGARPVSIKATLKRSLTSRKAPAPATSAKKATKPNITPDESARSRKSGFFSR